MRGKDKMKFKNNGALRRAPNNKCASLAHFRELSRTSRILWRTFAKKPRAPARECAISSPCTDGK